MKTITTLAVVSIALLITACTQTTSAPPANSNANSNASKIDAGKPHVDRAAEEASLKAADMAWAEAAGRKDVEATAGFMTDDGATLPPGAPIAKGKEAVKKGWSDLLGLKDLVIKWEPTMVQVAESGEIGYTSGTYSIDYTDEKGAKINEKGNYLEVWKKVDGKWKCYLDMFNSDGPAK